MFICVVRHDRRQDKSKIHNGGDNNSNENKDKNHDNKNAEGDSDDDDDIDDEDDNEKDVDWSELKSTKESPRVKKAKKKLKKIFEAKYNDDDYEDSDIKKDALEIKKAKIHANKRDFNARRVANFKGQHQNQQNETQPDYNDSNLNVVNINLNTNEHQSECLFH